MDSADDDVVEASMEESTDADMPSASADTSLSSSDDTPTEVPFGSLGLSDILSRCVDTGGGVDRMELALAEVRQGSMSKRRAAVKWGVAKTTLCERLKHPRITKKCGRPPAVTATMNDHVLEMFLCCAEFDVFVSKEQVRPILTEVAAKKGVSCTFGSHWIRTFHNRHPEVVRRRMDAKARRRESKWTAKQLATYAELLVDLHDRGYLTDPQRIFYIDQCRVLLTTETDSTGKSVEGRRVRELNIMTVGTASGRVLEPLVLLDNLVVNTDPWAAAAMTEAAATPIPTEPPRPYNDETAAKPVPYGAPHPAVFMAYLENELLPYLESLPVTSSQKAVIFYTDKHAYCRGLPWLKLCLQNEMMAVMVPPEQPLNVASWEGPAFEIMQWEKRPNATIRVALEQLKLCNFPQLLHEYTVEYKFDRNLPTEFLRAGIYPFNEDVVKGVVRAEELTPVFPIHMPTHGIWLRDFRISLVKKFALTKEEGNAVVRVLVNTINNFRGAPDYGQSIVQLLKAGVQAGEIVAADDPHTDIRFVTPP